MVAPASLVAFHMRLRFKIFTIRGVLSRLCLGSFIFVAKPVSRDTPVYVRYVEARLRRSATDVVFCSFCATWLPRGLFSGATLVPLILINWFLVFVDCLSCIACIGDVFCLFICFLCVTL